MLHTTLIKDLRTQMLVGQICQKQKSYNRNEVFLVTGRIEVQLCNPQNSWIQELGHIILWQDSRLQLSILALCFHSQFLLSRILVVWDSKGAFTLGHARKLCDVVQEYRTTVRELEETTYNIFFWCVEAQRS